MAAQTQLSQVLWETNSGNEVEAGSQLKRARRSEYQRRWRANADKRAQERRKLSRARGIKRYRESLGESLPVAQRVGRCALCRHRTPKFKVQRLRPTETGLEVMELRYCGEC